MSDQYYETFYFWVIIIFWVIVPAIMGVGVFLYFSRLSNSYMAHKKFVDDRKWQVKWGYTITGKPYKKDEGWGTSYSKLSKDEYLKQLEENKVQ